jgi:hypothetical protein
VRSSRAPFIESLDSTVSEHRKAAERALRAIFVPRIKAQGFSGSFPNFRRRGGDEVQAVSIRFDKYGEGFVVEAGRMTLAQFEELSMQFSPPLTFERFNTAHTGRRTRFGPELFRYEAWSDPAHYEALASEAARAFEQGAEEFYSAV